MLIHCNTFGHALASICSQQTIITGTKELGAIDLASLNNKVLPLGVITTKQ